MNDVVSLRIDDPANFKEFAGEDAAAVIIIKKNSERLLVIPEGIEYEKTPAPGTIHSLQMSSCYYKCVNGRLYYCCDGMCWRIGDC